jgi:hypothetical protein
LRVGRIGKIHIQFAHATGLVHTFRGTRGQKRKVGRAAIVRKLEPIETAAGRCVACIADQPVGQSFMLECGQSIVRWTGLQAVAEIETPEAEMAAVGAKTFEGNVSLLGKNARSRVPGLVDGEVAGSESQWLTARCDRILRQTEEGGLGEFQLPIKAAALLREVQSQQGIAVHVARASVAPKPIPGFAADTHTPPDGDAADAQRCALRVGGRVVVGSEGRCECA